MCMAIDLGAGYATISLAYIPFRHLALHVNTAVASDVYPTLDAHYVIRCLPTTIVLAAHMHARNAERPLLRLQTQSTLHGCITAGGVVLGVVNTMNGVAMSIARTWRRCEEGMQLANCETRYQR